MNTSNNQLVMILSFCLLLGCASAPTRPTVAIPLPEDVKIVKPDMMLSQAVRGFSGKWFGVWDGVLEHILVVEQINPPKAVAIYAIGESQSRRMKASYSRTEGQIEPNKLEFIFKRPAIVTYFLQPDGTLKAAYEWSGGISYAIMKRLEE
jgi:hypothetical protein